MCQVPGAKVVEDADVHSVGAKNSAQENGAEPGQSAVLHPTVPSVIEPQVRCLCVTF